MPASAFYDAGPLTQVAINLFYGWGYNFYRLENQLRADDLMIRAKSQWLLGLARANVEAAESAYRRTHMPPPTRAKPFPDAEAIAGAGFLERLSRGIGGLEARIRAQPVPENDRMSQRYRRESVTLRRLGECDTMLIGQAELLRDMLDGKDGASILALMPAIEDGLGAIAATLRQREAALLDTE
jgi:hypothetical protein